jgi:hypothetical protein
MAQTHNSLLATTGTACTLANAGYSGTINGYSGTSITTITDGSGLTLSGNSTINFSNQIQNSMTPKQVHVAVFTIHRDSDTNEINSTKFVKELWVEQKNGTSIDLIVAKHLDKDFDPETTIIKVLSTVSF